MVRLTSKHGLVHHSIRAMIEHHQRRLLVAGRSISRMLTFGILMSVLMDSLGQRLRRELGAGRPISQGLAFG